MTENVGIRISLSGAQTVSAGLAGVNKEIGALQGGAVKVADALRGMGAALVAGLSVGALAAWTRQTINALDAMNDVADATGASIESISRLEAVALRTGATMDTVAGSLVKLNQQLAAAKPDNEAGMALKMIGLEAEALRRIDPADALRQVAIALAQFESDGAKARIVQELFGKSIREVAPLLNDLAEAGEVSATVTAKQVAEAERFNKQLFLLSANLTQTARSVTSDFLPAINGLLERVNQIDDNKLQRFIDRMMTLGSPAFAVIMRQLQGAVASASGAMALPSTGADPGRAAINPEPTKKALGNIDKALANNKAAAKAAQDALKAYQDELELYAKRALKAIQAVDDAEEAANKALAEDAKQLAANYQRRIEGIDQAEEAMNKSLQTAQDMVDGIVRETEQLQMSNVERQVSIALLELERAGLEKGTYAYEQYAAKIRAAVVGRENVRESIERQRDIAAEYQRMADQVGQSLTNALMDGGRNAADYIKGLFRTMVLRPVIQAVVGGALGVAPSSLGGGSASSGVGGTLSMLSSVNTAYSAITRGFASVGANVSEALLRAGDYLATSSSNMMASAGEWLQNVSQGAGTLAASIAGAAAGYFAKNAISRGYSVSRGMDTIQNIAIAVGSYISPVLGTIVGAVSGLINRAFGRRLRDTGIRGTFGGESGFTGESYRFYQGGWFRSDRTTTDQLDTGTQRSLANAFRQMQLSTAQMGAILNRPLDAIVNFTRDVQVSLQGLSDEQAAKALQDELTAVAEALAEAALGTSEFSREGETAVATLERLSRSLLSVNAIFDTLGYTAYAAGLAGADMASQLADSAGGLENLSSITTAYYETFYSEAERAETTTRQVSEALGNLGLTMPATREAFRQLVEAQDLTTAAGRQTFVALLNLAPAFASVVQEVQATTDATDELAAAAEALRLEQERAAEVARERAGLERELLQVQGDTAALRALDLAALDESNRALQQRIWAIQDEAAAQERLAAVANQRAGLERELLQVQGDTAALRALDLAALDESNRALQQRIWAIQDEAAALEQRRNEEAAALERWRSEEAAALDQWRESMSAAAARAQSDFEDAQRASDAALSRVKDAIEAERTAAVQALRDQAEAQAAIYESQKRAAELARDAAAEQVEAVREVFALVGDQLNAVRGAAGLGMSAAAGAAFIEQAIVAARATGYLPSTDQLGAAIEAARGGLDSRQFSSAVEFRRAQVRLAISLEDLQAVAGDQLDRAQAALSVQELQLAALDAAMSQSADQFEQQIAQTEAMYDAQIAAAEAQLAELRGISTGILSVAEAMAQLSGALQAESAARTAAASAAASARTAGQATVSPSRIAGLYNDLVVGGSMNEAQFVTAARQYGVTDDQLVAAQALVLAQRAGQRFAAGGAFAGGVVTRPSAFPLGLMGEAGPEAIMPLSRGPNGALGVRAFGSDEMVAELQAVRAELEGLRAEARATAVHTSKAARILDRVTPDGNSLQTVAAP
jgi:hypothetical protein